jgi:hypothetical protein
MSVEGKSQYDLLKNMGVKGALEPTKENIARVPDKYKRSKLGLDSISSSSDYLKMPSSVDLEKKSTAWRERELPSWLKKPTEENIGPSLMPKIAMSTVDTDV